MHVRAQYIYHNGANTKTPTNASDLVRHFMYNVNVIFAVCVGYLRVLCSCMSMFQHLFLVGADSVYCILCLAS